MIKKLICSTALLVASSGAYATAPGGDGCGWGNMLFEGQSGPAPHILGATTNEALTGNATFGMTSGTNGCKTDGKLTYGGKSMISSIMDRFSEDVAQGSGEALDAVAVIYNIAPEDRATFAEVTHENFKVIFPTAQVTADDVISSLETVMKADARLAKYVI